MAYDPKAQVRRLFEEAWSKGNLEFIDEYADAGMVARETLMTSKGPEQMKQAVRTYRSAFPDLKFTVEHLLVEGDLVVARWTSTGTHQGDFNGIPPTGKKGTVQGISIIRFNSSGKAIEDHTVWDALGLFRQLGAELTMKGQAVPLAAPTAAARPEARG